MSGEPAPTITDHASVASLRGEDAIVALDGMLAGLRGGLSLHEGRILYQHIQKTRPEHVLELGSGHGSSACYIAAALEANGTGHLTTVDHSTADFVPRPEDLLDRAGLRDRVTIVREHTVYTWFLKEQIQARSDADGNCEPLYDLCFLDGAHNWTVDGLAVYLVEKLLRPDGWLVLDDLRWSGLQQDEKDAIFPGHVPSAGEREEHHVQAVFDLIVRQHPAFAETYVLDDMWGWARKAPGEQRRYSVESSQSFGTMLALTLLRATRRLSRRIR